MTSSMSELQTVSISATNPNDLDAVIGLLRTSGLPVEDIDVALLANFRKAVDASGIVGVAGLELLGDGDAMLRSLAVRDDCRERGIGRRLTCDLERHAGALALKRLHLLTDTAERYFAGLGYRSIARSAVPTCVAETTQFKVLCPASAVCMRKELDPSGASTDR